MKRKNLPLSLALISIVLGGIIFGFSNSQSESKYIPRSSDNESLVYGIKPSVEYIALIRNNQTTGVIAPEYLNRVQDQLKDFEESRSFVNLTWRQLGPDNFGGRTRAIMFDNQDATAKTLYAAGVSGGIWKSENVGISWQKINSESYNLNVTCMQQDAGGTIYAGTGESFAAETMSGLEEMGFTGGFMGQGIFKSTDGNNFTLIPSTQPQFNDANSDWAFINELAVNLNSGSLFAATNSGLKYSTDGGNSWSVAKDTSGAELVMNSFDVQVSSDGAIVACIDNSCYISTSGDVDAFVNRSTGDSVSLPSEDVGRIEFAFAPSDPNVLYASVVDNDGSLYNIYRSDDKGLNWRIIQPGSPSISIFSGQGVYDNALAVFPEDPDRIILGGVDAWDGRKIQETGFFGWSSISTAIFPPFFPNYLHVDHHAYVFQPGSNNTFMVGTDGGVAIGSIVEGEYVFEGSNRNYFTTQFYNIGPSGIGNYVLGGAQDNGTILITGDGNTTKQGEMILGGDGGACVVSLIDRNVLVVSDVDADLRRSEDGGANYSTQFIDDLSLAANFFNTPMALWESFNNENSRDSLWYYAKAEITGGTRIQVQSKNSGQPFYYTTPANVTLMPGDSILVKDIVSSRYFIATFNKVYMTNELHRFEKTPEWFEVSNNTVGLVGASQCISYSSDANHVFVGTRDGKLYRISNLALAYNYDRADVNSPECIVSTQEIPLYVPGTSDPITQVVTSVAIDPDNPANVMITLGNYGNDYYVLYSENALDEVPVFESRQGNLPQMPVYSSVIEMTNTDLGIIGTEHGIFVTENIHASSPNWIKQDSLMGSVQVFQLQQQIVSKTADTVILINGNEIIKIPFPGTDNYGVIYAATFGRGLLRCNVFQKTVGLEEIYNNQNTNILDLIIYPNPVTTYATIKLEAFINSTADIFVYDLAGRKVLSTTNNVKRGMNEFDLDVSGLNNGTYIVQVVIGSDIYSQKFIAN
ncbi:MAG: hypothetical protein CL661_03335 [Bacteroidetes bacterium]|nr:hypothetical protein [Bacteroidota bacterium]|tara:strand:+ start:273 stop:3209 length:2937 start_codon:yes stop_codon:yes gene_type:complete